MEQAQFGVLEIDWFIASLQPMRWIKVPGGRSRARRGRTYSATRYPCQPLRECIFWTTDVERPNKKRCHLRMSYGTNIGDAYRQLGVVGASKSQIRDRNGSGILCRSKSANLGLVLPEIAEPLGRKFAISNRMLDVLVAEIVLQRPSIHTLIG